MNEKFKWAFTAAMIFCISKKYQGLILGIFVATILYGCTPHRLPSKPALIAPLPEIAEGKGMVFLFAGSFFKSSPLGFAYTMPLDDRSCEIFIEKQKITYINHDEVFAVDLPAGQYNIHWEPTKYDRNKRQYYEWLQYDLKLNKGEIVFLSMNIRDVVEPGILKWSPLFGWTIGLEKEMVAGEEALETRKIVEYQNLSVPIQTPIHSGKSKSL